MLLTATTSLLDRYDLMMFDLDGVVYVGGQRIDGVADVVSLVRAAGRGVAFVTNNASRTPGKVAEKLTKMGVPAQPTDVVTSAQAAARMLRDRFGARAPIVLLGAAGLDAALRAEDLEPVNVENTEAVALSTGYSPDAIWRDIMRAAVRVRGGLPWVATNTDLSIPTDYGLAPGHGVLVGMLQRFTGVDPLVAGKPQRPLFDETIRRVGGDRPLMIGDRLDTDIEGANNAGLDSLLVLTGVSGLADLAAAPRARRPTYISPDLGGLFVPHQAPVRDTSSDAPTFLLGGWVGWVAAGELVVTGEGESDTWWRVAASAAWEYLDRTGTVVSLEHTRSPLPRRVGGPL
jgi:glycerol 3-phosphatase-2